MVRTGCFETRSYSKRYASKIQTPQGSMNSRDSELAKDYEDSPEPSKPPVPATDMPWVPLLALLSVYISNQWCRALIYYVNNFSSDVKGDADPAFLFANVDLGFGPTEYATLASFGFTALFAVASLFAGRLADTQDRLKLTVGSCVAFSAVTAAMGGAHSYPDLFVLRSLQGLAMAATAPAAYSLISDLTPPSRLASANSIYSAGIYFGGALASLGVVLDERLGWRGTSITVGAVSLATALLCSILVTDPRKNEQERSGIDLDRLSSAREARTPSKQTLSERVRQEAGSFVTSVGTVVSTRSTQLLFAGTTFRFCAGFGLAVWKAPFYLGKFPELADEFSLVNAGIVAAGGGMSAVVGGRLADALAERSSGRPEAARMMVPIWGSFLAAPMLAAALRAETLPVSLGFLLAEYLVAECWVGPTIACVYTGLPDNRFRGTAQGAFSLLTAAGNLAPVVIGGMVASNGIFGMGILADTSLEDAMIWIICSAYLISAVLFGIAGASFPTTHTVAKD